MTWEELRSNGAVALVPLQVSALADAIGELLANPDKRAALGSRASSFYDRRMSAESVADQVGAILHAAFEE
jgi:hypothetical protein